MPKSRTKAEPTAFLATFDLYSLAKKHDFFLRHCHTELRAANIPMAEFTPDMIHDYTIEYQDQAFPHTWKIPNKSKMANAIKKCIDLIQEGKYGKPKCQCITCIQMSFESCYFLLRSFAYDETSNGVLKFIIAIIEQVPNHEIVYEVLKSYPPELCASAFPPDKKLLRAHAQRIMYLHEHAEYRLQQYADQMMYHLIAEEEDKKMKKQKK